MGVARALSTTPGLSTVAALVGAKVGDLKSETGFVLALCLKKTENELGGGGVFIAGLRGVIHTAAGGGFVIPLGARVCLGVPLVERVPGDAEVGGFADGFGTEDTGASAAASQRTLSLVLN